MGNISYGIHTIDEIQDINQQVQELAQEVELLDTAPTSYTCKR